jgi:lipoate-protein ligase B
MPPEGPQRNLEIQANFEQVKTAIQEQVQVFVDAHPEWQLINGTRGDEYAEVATFGSPETDGTLVFQTFELVTTGLKRDTLDYKELLSQLEQTVISAIKKLGFKVGTTLTGAIKIQL